MRITSVASRSVRWPIAGGGAARGRSERAALIVELRGADEDIVNEDLPVVGLGEAAPLAGMSIDVLADAERAVAALAAELPIAVADCDAAYLWAARVTRAPAARFAIETALLAALADSAQAPLSCMLRRDHSLLATQRPKIRHRDGYNYGITAVPLSVVVDDADQARQAAARGVTSLKIKLGPDDELARVEAIAAAAPEARLRIDGNGTWPRREVARKLAALARLPIDYVEEPCGAAHELLARPGELACKLALDDSLTGLTLDELRPVLASPALAALVLKPTLLGGLSATLALAQLARQHGVAAVMSHALEGPIGTAACAELALALGGEVAVGLAPHGGLTGWAIEVPQLAANRVRPSDLPGLGLSAVELATVTALAPAAAALAPGPGSR